MLLLQEKTQAMPATPKRLNADIESDQYQAFKVAAAQDGVTIGHLTRAFVDAYLKDPVVRKTFAERAKEIRDK